MICTREAGPRQRPRVRNPLRDPLMFTVLAGVIFFRPLLATAETTGTSPTASALASQLIENLEKLNLASGTLSAGQAAWLKQKLAELSALGTNALPAIGEFLKRNADLYFDAPGSAERAGAPSLRVALIEVVGRDRKPEALALLKTTFQSTADPTELATLAKLIARAEPGRHEAEISAAARETLALAASGKWDGRDVAPLFEMLKKFGGAAAPADLERYANTWPDYTAITLPALPDGAGVPLLIKLAQNADGRSSSGRESYQRALVEAALKHPAARQALLDQVHAGKIAVTAWPDVAAALAGNTWHLARPVLYAPSPLVARPDTRSHLLSKGHQAVLEATAPDNLAAREMGERVRLIDQLLERTTEPAALDALEGARIQLSEKLSRAK